MERMRAVAGVRSLLFPTSIAVVGASPRNLAAVETVVASGVTAWGVNPNRDALALRLLGERCSRQHSLGELHLRLRKRAAFAGLELADSVRQNAIILDMRMPITNGLQFLRLVRAKPHLVDVPVAIVTGDYFLSEPIEQELKSLGASIRFKPLWMEDLIALAKTLVA